MEAVPCLLLLLLSLFSSSFSTSSTPSPLSACLFFLSAARPRSTAAHHLRYILLPELGSARVEPDEGEMKRRERKREREDGRIIISKSLQIFTQKAYRVSCGGSEVRAHLPSYRFQLIASRRLRLAPCKTPRVRSRVFARGYVCTRPPTGNDHYRAVVGMMVRERAGVSTETSNFRGKERMTVTDESPLRSQV